MHPPSFFDRSALAVAPELLGAVLSHDSERGRVAIRITEVEAYLGNGEDPGSHAHRGPTPRTTVMFGEAARIYTYLSYGMHVCMNVVCSPAGQASAVLLRGGEVIAGHELARSRHPGSKRDQDLARGPGVLARALGVGLADYGRAVDEPPFSLELPIAPLAPSAVNAGPRTGVGGVAGGYPWRFWIAGEPSVSRYQRHKTAVDEAIGPSLG